MPVPIFLMATMGLSPWAPRCTILYPMPLLWMAARSNENAASTIIRLGAVQPITRPEVDSPVLPLGWSSTSPGFQIVPFLVETNSVPVVFLPMPQ